VSKPLTVAKAEKSKEALIKAVYSSMFDVIVDKVNSSISLSSSSLSAAARPAHDASISSLDIFGFESFTHNSF
jgi:myosin-5